MTDALPPSAAPIAQARATYNTFNPRTADTRTHVHYIIYTYVRVYTYFYFTVILLMRFYRRVTRLVIIIIIIGIRASDFYNNCRVSWKYFNGHINIVPFCIECQLLRRPFDGKPQRPRLPFILTNLQLTKILTKSKTPNSARPTVLPNK